MVVTPPQSPGEDNGGHWVNWDAACWTEDRNPWQEELAGEGWHPTGWVQNAREGA